MGTNLAIIRIFYVYMALIGGLAGAALVTWPALQDIWLKPYFWILIAIALFDGGLYLRGRSAGAPAAEAAPWTALSMPARAIGFIIGMVAMMALSWIAGVEVRVV